MKVHAINDYLTTNLPCLHINPEEGTGSFMHSMRELNSVIVTIWEKEYRRNDNELDFLMNTPIDFGIYEKNGHVMPIIKIGPDENPYLYYLGLNPVDPQEQHTIDLWVESRLIVFCFVEGEKELVIRGIRVLGIPDNTRDYLCNKWIDAIEQGVQKYSMKYLNFLKSFENKAILELWNQAIRMEPFEE